MCLEEGIRLKIKKFINKIKQFFKNFISRNKLKQIEVPKNSDYINKEEKSLKNQNQKKEFFEIYEKVKKSENNLNDLTEEQNKKIIEMLKTEINLKRDKLNNEVTELKILKADNRITEKNRIFEIYNGIKNETIDLNEIDRKDLLKIRKLFLAEAKLQNEKLEDEIDILDMLKMVS